MQQPVHGKVYSARHYPAQAVTRNEVRRMRIDIVLVSRQGASAVAEVSFTGGSLVGMVNASWPLARLTASAQQLTLSGLGTYVFSEQEVVSLEPYGSIPWLASGIRIRHNRLDYPGKVVFWCMGRRAAVLDGIQAVGFRPQGQDVARPSGMPIRWSVAILAAVIWNALFYADGAFRSSGAHARPGACALLAMLLVFGIASALPYSAGMQRVVLRPGHVVGEIRQFLRLLQLVTGLLSLIAGSFLVFSRG